MPNKYPDKKGWKVPKQKYKLSNWSEYNESLRRRGSIDVWLSLDAISHWYEADRVYDGTGAPKRYSDFAIRTCHEIRLVYRLPLRQTQGFIDSLLAPGYGPCLLGSLNLNDVNSRYSKMCIRPITQTFVFEQGFMMVCKL